MDQSLAEGAGLEKLSPQQKEELMKTVQTQVALANMQELLTVIIKNFIKISTKTCSIFINQQYLHVNDFILSRK